MVEKRVAALERGAVKQFARDAHLFIPERDTCLGRGVVGDEIGEAVEVHVF